MTPDPPLLVTKLTRFGVTTQNLDALVAFYERAFGCRQIESSRCAGPAFEQEMSVRGGADRVTLALGAQVIELLAFEEPGRPYPRDTTARDPTFQHFAIVVDGMDQAYARLSTIPGWTAISRGGPQRLPESSGGVTAFKFRDPDGHPLELLEFASSRTPQGWRRNTRSGACLGIDHSAVTVRDTTVSVSFYNHLGFLVSGRSFNVGPEQARLDDLPDVEVVVTALASKVASPHLELLSYKGVAWTDEPPRRANDVAATRLTFAATREIDEPEARITGFDPDGRRLIFEMTADATAAA